MNLSPIKPVPRIVFYKFNSNNYRMLDLKNNSVVGDMMVTLRDKELFINSIYIQNKERGKGYGTKFLHFAKKISESLGKNGKMRCLVGALGMDTIYSSHVFFRKNGFGASDCSELQKIDEAIKNKKLLDCTNSKLMYMYYPSEK